MVGRFAIDKSSAESMRPTATAALREVGVMCHCVWLDSASNHTTDTSTGDDSQAALRMSMRDVVIP